ncbi:ABC transporter ATP-binding protein [Kitasatospora sp. A2-31]|uniref:ABC transporter ATP-binding protein n=1 Tax=Kitasatospora sp. A2-31 TaxID=2916414 RepID=UPI001EEE85DA|nr:ABC transporter ATP-binding protein [Kitasatospora sp. A2-31]MCG6499224.1 ABC transporter ATP-binding protein/permease [Kitasatospora sp. A2-31]
MTSGTTKPDEPASGSEQLLFGGPMRYDYGWAKHELASGEVTFWAVARQMPRFLRLAGRMAWQADRRALVALVGAEVLRGLAAAAALIATNRALSAVLAPGEVGQVLRAALPAVVTVGALAALSSVLSALSAWAGGRLEPAVFRRATVEFLGIVSRSELEAIEDPEFLAEVDSARWGAMSLQNIIGQATSVLTAGFSLVSAAGVLSVLHPVLLPMLVLITAPRGWGAVLIARRQYASTRSWLQHSRASTALADMMIRPYSAAEQRVHASGPFLLHHYEQMAASAEQEQARLAAARARTDLLTATLAGLATTGAFALLGWLVVDGSIPLAAAGTAVVALRTGSASIGGLVSQVNRLYEESLFVRDLDQLRRDGHRRAIPTGGTPLPERPETITVEEVTFSYPGREAPALDKISLTIPRGKVVALVGRNGSGKTTLAHILCGVYQPHQGKVLWDGVDTATADRHQQFRSVALLAQNFQRWIFTLRANLLLGRPEVPLGQEHLDAAADYADLQPVLDELPRGWNTLLAKGFEGGVQLSGGQWQKVALARTRLRLTTPDQDNRLPALVVVDEPTSALDPQAEVAAFEQIRHLTELGVTVVLITHRLGATAKADHIFVLDHGRLIEEGTHADLMARQPATHYREGYLLQARQYDTTVPVQTRGRDGADTH